MPIRVKFLDENEDELPQGFLIDEKDVNNAFQVPTAAAWVHLVWESE